MSRTRSSLTTRTLSRRNISSRSTTARPQHHRIHEVCAARSRLSKACALMPASPGWSQLARDRAVEKWLAISRRRLQRPRRDGAGSVIADVTACGASPPARDAVPAWHAAIPIIGASSSTASASYDNLVLMPDEGDFSGPITSLLDSPYSLSPTGSRDHAVRRNHVMSRRSSWWLASTGE